jgi:hypothetical protein
MNCLRWLSMVEVIQNGLASAGSSEIALQARSDYERRWNQLLDDELPDPCGSVDY